MLAEREFLSIILTRSLFMVSVGLIGCTGIESNKDDGEPPSNTDPELPASYQFTASAGQSTVSYSGQTARHLLIQGLDDWLGTLTTRIDDGSYQPETLDSMTADLDFYFECAADLCMDMPVGDSTTIQQTLADISSGKNLVGKLAGNDPVTDHQDWKNGSFAGWEGANSPESLVRDWFEAIAGQGFSRVNGELLLDPQGQPIASVVVTAEGLDLQQLTEKFLLGALPFSQGTDDYLDDDVEGKGLLASHSSFADSGSYTDLEHAWDEGFGYFGAARNFAVQTDEQVAAGELVDMDGDGLIDFRSEMNWGHSINAAKRDLGASSAAPTDFSSEAWEGFVGGRQLLADTAGSELSDADFQALLSYRDQAVSAWEKAIAATVVHYINDVLQDMSQMHGSSYSFASHAKHWSELKGFALGLQFNPASPLSDADFVEFHGLVGDRPVLETASEEERLAYQEALVEARGLLGASYGFHNANLGDSGGNGGW